MSVEKGFLGMIGQPVSELLGFEGNRHGDTTQTLNHIDLMGYGFTPVPKEAAPSPDANLNTPQPKPFSLDF